MGHNAQAVLELDLRAKLADSPVVVAVRNDLVVDGDPRRNDVKVYASLVMMAIDDVRATREPKLFDHPLNNGLPLLGSQRLVIREPQRQMKDRAAQPWPQSPDRGELPRKLTGIGADHVAAHDVGALLGREVIEEAAEASALDGNADH
ncbi:MAG: hypothetical protein M3O15_12875 [Acidobacteriota bacterium]|nr:hypothetical protein [Acidobacteriota bacterium]